ncbi:nucleoporin complex subunit 54-domain-containing protein [Epithele typhae]|uniref:nucleoporin complex subunit 54-domain-containing protein n=1 Tax=Epithele typhae TaxID=378194 RepID=UPI002007EB0D|nr:nucleoporin complex subunit 54-domain-containing protein [Epithele typhae]KAH9925020.1 nucleoporin complex subunit 54-domain-containing protein [Epithele typhae]
MSFGAFGTASAQPSGSAFGAFGSTQNTSGPLAGSSLFGNNTNTNTAGGGLFGATNTNTNAQPSGGPFGATTGGGPFGTMNPPAGGGPFGNTNATQQQTNASVPSGGLFGSTQPAQTGGLFGNTNTNPSGNVGSGLFGSTNTTTTGGGLFGTTNANTTGGGLFGTTNTTAPSGGMFGSTTAAPSGGLFGNTANTTGGGMFGNTNTNTTAPSSGLFGSTATGGGLFGSTTAAPTTGGGLFGSTAPATGTSGGLFGNTTQPQAGSSFFSSTNQPAQTGSLFANMGQQQRPANTGLFGAGGSILGASTIGGGALGASNLFTSKSGAPNPQQDAQTQSAQLQQKIESIASAWNPNNPQCRFQHYFYNLVEPSQVHLYGRPANATNEAQWQKAMRENPDPSCFVPVIATGFDDLQKRVEAQTQQAATHQERIKDLQARIAALVQAHQLKNASRLQRASALQTQLTHRVLKLVQHLHLLIPALRSSALRPEEEALRTALEELDEEVRRPGGTGRIRGKLNELWALVGAVSAARDRDRRAGRVEWTVVDEDGLAQIAQVLADEQAGLVHLTKLLHQDMKDLAVIQGTGPEEDPESFMSSTATLRASTL